jgi:oligoendopeptidase F
MAKVSILTARSIILSLHQFLDEQASDMSKTLSQTWDLQSLMAHPAAADFAVVLQNYRVDLNRLADQSDALPAVTGAAANVKQWVDFLAEYQRIETLSSDLHALIGCYAAEDATNKQYLQLDATISSLDPLRERVATNIDFAFKAASDAEITAFIAADKTLQKIEYFCRARRKHAAFRLPKEQESLAADLAVDGIHAWGRLYDRLSGELRITVMEKGELVKKSVGQVRFDMPDRATRENNFYAADKAWATVEDTCADALNHLAGTRLSIYKRLGVQDHLDLPLRYNRMTRETLNAMWSAISARKEMLLNYCEKKAKALGVDRLAWFDQSAPYPIAKSAGKSEEIPYDDAVAHIVRTFSEFSPDFGEFAEMAVKQRWIEAENRSGKRQGGFCTGFPGKGESRIFMTYTDSEDSMSTLAHELGHAYHSWVLRDQPLVLQDYPMNLAETASTFAECVLAEARLAACQTKEERLGLLDNMLSDAVAFLMNIHCRFIFENNFHTERAQGELTADRISELMTAAQKEAYCGCLSDDGWNGRFWVSKLHFYISGLPFYNFPYTFGYLLSLGSFALAKDATSATDDFPAKYRSLLLATGCQDAEEAVRSTLGYDLTKPDFWNKSLDVVESRVNRFLELVD